MAIKVRTSARSTKRTTWRITWEVQHQFGKLDGQWIDHAKTFWGEDAAREFYEHLTRPQTPCRNVIVEKRVETDTGWKEQEPWRPW